MQRLSSADFARMFGARDLLESAGEARDDRGRDAAGVGRGATDAVEAALDHVAGQQVGLTASPTFGSAPLHHRVWTMPFLSVDF
ncbi:MAG: hypothetical protein ACLQHS_06650 [Candidatus Limnocylindrales bacterium]